MSARAACWAGLGLLAAVSCGPRARSYDVEVSGERVCRTFDPQPESCALTSSPSLAMTITIEDRAGAKAIVYGRSDSGAERVYLADMPREGRYESVERSRTEDAATGCASDTTTTLAIDVDDRGLAGGEEFKVDEAPKCNDANQHRLTRRTREWAGSRVASER